MDSIKIGDLTVQVPVIQGGMGIGVSMSGLATAVANMGGVGVIATVGLGLMENLSGKGFRESNIKALKKEIRKARELSSGIIGVNIMTVLTNFADLVETSIDEGIDIILSGAGLPLDLPKYLPKGSKTKLVPIVSSGRAASIICNKWQQNYDYLPDAIVVEGPKAGGHLGFKAEEITSESNSLETLITEVLKVTKEVKEKFNKDIPVIAAGGIFTGEDIFNIMKIGAAGVQMGTRFVATEECDASIEFKNAYINAKEEDVRIIKSPVGLPGRAIDNQFMQDAYAGKRSPKMCRYHCIKSCNPKTTLYCIADALLSAYEGKLDDGFVFSGSNVWRVNEITTVEKVFVELEKEYQQAKNKN